MGDETYGSHQLVTRSGEMAYSKKMKKAVRRDKRKRARDAKIDHKRKGLGTYSGGGTWVSSEEMKESRGYGRKD